ncbi:A disintegrin and metalloproteinase with thrombospondin motifs 12 [Oryzias melastigma]|uniref:A disintegrin and metalloproteinase with thrombospondin motifs 12 n=1 Tax=Oryzias melastigma TaxID=30732 RepID=A0A834CE06_ORYME|nr:A disintegrin and metalloproteinase with thrombospondin motifs 12 [Oryzias melastigma]
MYHVDMSGLSCSWEECSVSCGGGVRSRNVTCTLKPRNPCNAATKPRSRSLCALQNCPNSSLHRKLPMSRRILPPKTPPSKHPRTTVAPTSTKKAATFIPKTTSLPNVEPTTPEIIDADDYDFSVGAGKTENPKNLTKSNIIKKQKKVTIIEDDNLEEGSTPTMLMYTAGYDYVVEDKTGGNISDAEVFTTETSLRSFLQVTPSKSAKKPSHNAYNQSTSHNYHPVDNSTLIQPPHHLKHQSGQPLDTQESMDHYCLQEPGRLLQNQQPGKKSSFCDTKKTVLHCSVPPPHSNNR